MKTIILLALLVPLTAFAEVFDVHSVSRMDDDLWIVKFQDGRVSFLREDPGNISGYRIEGELTSKLHLKEVKLLGKVRRQISFPGEKEFNEPPYTPTVYPDYKFASKVLKKMRKDWKDSSQCYDRSHIWAYEESLQGRFLQKVFLFFSDSYIARYRFPWWFHTAPYALVMFNGEVKEFVMDKYFNKYPIAFRNWTDMFMKNDPECKVVDKYSGFSTHPNEDDCYLIKSTMYFWQPRDLDDFERSGTEKTGFVDWEVKWAYEHGFRK